MSDGGIEKQEEENHAKSHDEGKKRREIAKGDVSSITYIHHIQLHISSTNKQPRTQCSHRPMSSLARPASPSRVATNKQ